MPAYPGMPHGRPGPYRHSRMPGRESRELCASTNHECKKDDFIRKEYSTKIRSFPLLNSSAPTSSQSVPNFDSQTLQGEGLLQEMHILLQDTTMEQKAAVPAGQDHPAPGVYSNWYSFSLKSLRQAWTTPWSYNRS